MKKSSQTIKADEISENPVVKKKIAEVQIEAKKEVKEVKKEAKKKEKDLEVKNNDLLQLLLETLATNSRDKSQFILSLISLFLNIICWLICFGLMAGKL